MRFQSFFRERRRELDFMQRSICVYLEIIRGEERIQRWEGKRINSFHCSSSSVITAAEGSVVTTGEARSVCSWAFQHASCSLPIGLLSHMWPRVISSWQVVKTD